MSTFIIAEFGSCHDNEWSRCVEGILAAKRAGADACKFQYWSSATRLADRRRAGAYLDVYKTYQMPVEWLPLLKAQCDYAGIEFMCTVYLPEDIPVITPFVKRFKVASFEAGHLFIEAHRPYGKPILVSTGMFEHWTALGTDVTYLQCVSAYPTPLDQASLGPLQWQREDESRPFAGYSDHTHHVLTGAFAVCAGAGILEVHFRLDDTDKGNPDYGTALSPGELTEYVSNVRLAERMLGDGVKRPQPAEADMMRYRVQP